MHLQRWITGIVAVPFLVGLIGWGSPGVLAMVVTAVALVCLWEYHRILFDTAAFKDLASAVGIGFAACPLLVWAAYEKGVGLLAAMFFMLFAATAVWVIYHYGRREGLFETAGKLLMAILHVPFSLALIVSIRKAEAGVAWTFMVLCIVFAGDIAAYYVGSYWGKKKLAPLVSPGKTVEGAIGGIGANLLIGMVFYLFFIKGPSFFGVLVMAISMGICGQVGDLFESVMKRSAGIKDSGNILPGHGGILDRLDALLFAIPVAYLFRFHIF